MRGGAATVFAHSHYSQNLVKMIPKRYIYIQHGFPHLLHFYAFYFSSFYCSDQNDKIDISVPEYCLSSCSSLIRAVEPSDPGLIPGVFLSVRKGKPIGYCDTSLFVIEHIHHSSKTKCHKYNTPK